MSGQISVDRILQHPHVSLSIEQAGGIGPLPKTSRRTNEDTVKSLHRSSTQSEDQVHWHEACAKDMNESVSIQAPDRHEWMATRA